MALETPNAIAAACTLQYDPVPALGSRFSLLASNGVLEKLGEFHIGAAVDVDYVAFSLETPITAEEGMPFCSFLRLVSDGDPETPAATGAPCFCMVKKGPVDDVGYDALPDGAFVLGTNAAVPVIVGGALLRIPRG